MKRMQKATRRSMYRHSRIRRQSRRLHILWTLKRSWSAKSCKVLSEWNMEKYWTVRVEHQYNETYHHQQKPGKSMKRSSQINNISLKSSEIPQKKNNNNIIHKYTTVMQNQQQPMQLLSQITWSGKKCVPSSSITATSLQRTSSPLGHPPRAWQELV